MEIKILIQTPQKDKGGAVAIYIIDDKDGEKIAFAARTNEQNHRKAIQMGNLIKSCLIMAGNL